VCPELVLGRAVWAAVAETVWHRVTRYRTSMSGLIIGVC
jgi:hypothetical protein